MYLITYSMYPDCPYHGFEEFQDDTIYNQYKEPKSYEHKRKSKYLEDGPNDHIQKTEHDTTSCI